MPGLRFHGTSKAMHCGRNAGRIKPGNVRSFRKKDCKVTAEAGSGIYRSRCMPCKKREPGERVGRKTGKVQEENGSLWKGSTPGSR